MITLNDLETQLGYDRSSHYHRIEDEPLEEMWGKFKKIVSDVSTLHQTLIALSSQYSKLNKLVKKSCRVDDNNRALRIAPDLEEAAKLLTT